MATPGPASPADLQQQASTAFQLLALQQVSAGLLASTAAAAPMPMPWPAAAAAGGGDAGGPAVTAAAAAATAVASMAPFVLPGPLVHLGGMNVAAVPPSSSVLQQQQLYTSLGLVGLVPLRGMPVMPVPQLQLVGGNQQFSMQPALLLAPPQQPPPPHPQRRRHPQQQQQQQPFVMVTQAVPQAVPQQQQQQPQALLLAPAAAPAAAAASGPGRLDGSAPEQPVSREALAKLFHLPLGQAAKQLGLGQTQFKVHARRHGISKWPFRKRQSVDQLIASIEAYAQTTTEAAELVAPALEKLRSFLAAIEHDPDINLDQPLKKLRQAFFKETHKLRQRAARRSDGPGNGVDAAPAAAAAGPAGGGYDEDDGEYERHHQLQGQGAAAGGWPGVWNQAAAGGVQAAAAAGGGGSGQQVAPGRWPPEWSGPYGGSGVPHQQQQHHHQQQHHQQHAAHAGRELEDDGLAGVVGEVLSCFAAFGDEDFMQLGAAPLRHAPPGAAAGPAAVPTAPVAAPFSPKAAAAAPAAAAPPGPAAPAAGALVPGGSGLGLVQLLQAV